MLLLHAGVPYLLAESGRLLRRRHEQLLLEQAVDVPAPVVGSHAGFQFARFFAISVVAFACNTALLATFVEVFDLGKIVSQFIAVILVMPVSFLGNKYWSFR